MIKEVVSSECGHVENLLKWNDLRHSLTSMLERRRETFPVWRVLSVIRLSESHFTITDSEVTKIVMNEHNQVSLLFGLSPPTLDVYLASVNI